MLQRISNSTKFLRSYYQLTNNNKKNEESLKVLFKEWQSNFAYRKRAVLSLKNKNNVWSLL